MGNRLWIAWICGVVLSMGQLRAQDGVLSDHPADTIPELDFSFSPTHLILPVSLIAVGAVGTAIDGMNDYHLFERGVKDSPLKIDDYLEWGMLGLVFVNDLFGKEKHNWVDQLMLVGLAEGMNALMVQTVKYTVNERRPNYSDYSFPSGHTSNAFLGAQLNFREFKDSSMLLALSGYPIAGFVAFARLYGKRHWMADVVAGAGFGILSAEMAYLIYLPLRNAIVKNLNLKTNSAFFIAPTFTGNGAGVHMSYTF